MDKCNSNVRLVKISPQAQAKIRSSIEITSLNDVIIGLIQNSLDAGAQHIDVRFDYLRGYCSVLDDGVGISKEEFLENGHLAQLYYTSKPAISNTYFGRYGRFLSSLVNVAIVSVTACTRTTDGSACSAIFRGGRCLVKDLDVSEDLGLGTSGSKIAVHNLFGDVPVRAKHRSIFEKSSKTQSEFQMLKKTLATLALVTTEPLALRVQSDMHQYVHRYPSKSDCSSIPERLVDQRFSLHRTVSTFFQAGLVESADPNTWQQVVVNTPHISARAAISLQPYPSRNSQIIAINQYPLSVENSALLFDHVNSLFAASTFGMEERHSFTHNEGEIYQPCTPLPFDVRQGEPQSSRGRKGVDRWPAFYVQVRLSDWTVLESLSSLESNRTMTLIMDSIDVMIAEFLQSHKFGPLTRSRRGKKSEHSDKTIIEHVKHDAFGFNSWSRTKSANSTPTDILTGLPFLSWNDSKTEVPTTPSQDFVTSPETTFSQADSHMIKWTNPRNDQELCIDSRTRMVLRSQPSLTQARVSTPFDKCSKTVTDIANHLKDRTPESALNTVTSAWQFALYGGCSVCISGPASVVDPIHVNSITKTSHLRTARILGQVDRKFILASVQSDDDSNHGSDTNLILVDQHAADERVKVEELFKQICDCTTISLAVPIVFEIDKVEARRFQDSQAYFTSWNILYTIDSLSTKQIRVSALPGPIVERCRLEPRLLIDLLRKEIWQDGGAVRVGREVKTNDWLSLIGACPQGVLDILASRACRSAVMFNDVLTIEQCRTIVKQLGSCLFPLQCAHGRPTLTQLARIQDIDSSKTNELDKGDFRKAWEAWTDTSI